MKTHRQGRKKLPYWVEDLPPAQYHSQVEFISASMLKTWREGGPRLFAMHYVDQSVPERTSKAMDEGTHKHLAFLERERWKSLVVEIPKAYLASNGNRSGDAWKIFLRDHPPPLIPLKSSEIEQMRAMCQEIDDLAGRMIWSPGYSEISLFWQNAETGAPCRCRVDRLCLLRDLAVFFDLKQMPDTTPLKFFYQARQFGFAYQAAHYSEGIREVFQLPARGEFVAVRSKGPPYLPTLNHFTEETLAAAQKRRIADLAQIQQCRKSGDWSDPSAALSNSCHIPIEDPEE